MQKMVKRFTEKHTLLQFQDDRIHKGRLTSRLIGTNPTVFVYTVLKCCLIAPICLVYVY